MEATRDDPLIPLTPASCGVVGGGRMEAGIAYASAAPIRWQISSACRGQSSAPPSLTRESPVLTLPRTD
jgi:hypothetical protein